MRRRLGRHKHSPTITITPSHPTAINVDGVEASIGYYAIDFTLEGKGIQEAKYYLSSKAAIDAILPNYNNDLSRIVKENGQKIWSDEIAIINSGKLVLGWDGAVPSTEYQLLVWVQNMHGELVQNCVYSTEPMPKGCDGYEYMIGKWKVTAAHSVSTSYEYTDKPISFEIEIRPNRVDKVYECYGWGITKFTHTMACQ